MIPVWPVTNHAGIHVGDTVQIIAASRKGHLAVVESMHFDGQAFRAFVRGDGFAFGIGLWLLVKVPQ